MSQTNPAPATPPAAPPTAPPAQPSAAPPGPPAQPPTPAPTPAAPAPPAAPAGQPAPVYQPPAQLAPPAPANPQQPVYVPVIPQPPAPPADSDDGGRDWTKLPQWAQQERASLKDENAKRRISERTALVNQHAYIAASQLGANAAALLGSTAFGDLARQLDPHAADFPQKLTDAINAVKASNPWVAAAPATPPAPGQPGQPAAPPTPPASGTEFPGGNTAGQPITEQQLAQMSPAEIQKAYEEGRLKHLL